MEVVHILELLELLLDLDILDDPLEIDVLLELVSEAVSKAVDEKALILRLFLLNIFFGFAGLGETVEVGLRNELAEKANEEHGRCNTNALNVVAGAKFDAAHRGTSELDQNDLDHDSDDSDQDEERVVEEPSENVKFVLELSGVDGVKYLHEHEHLEEQSVLFSQCLSVIKGLLTTGISYGVNVWEVHVCGAVGLNFRPEELHIEDHH